MTFQPIVPFGGTAGWAFLQRTRDAQQATFDQSAIVQREVEHFRDKIGQIETAEDLVSDYRLMKVALGAFGLDDDLPNKAYIQKVLEEGSLDPDSFANRMVDKRYLALTEAFGFDLDPPKTKLSDFSDGIIQSYKTRQFEIAVGDQSTDMRLALGLERDLGEIVGGSNSADGKWYAVMGNEPLRRVFETALGLPPAFAALDIDRQLEDFRDKAAVVFGDGGVEQFSDPGKLEELTRLFLVRSQISESQGGMSPGNIALTLLQNMR